MKYAAWRLMCLAFAVVVFLLPFLLLAGCQTARNGLEFGGQVYESIEAAKAAEKAAKDAERLAKEKAEADRIAAENAERERKEAEAEAAERAAEAEHIQRHADGPKTIAQGKKMLWKPASENTGRPLLLFSRWYYGKVVGNQIAVNGETFTLVAPYDDFQEAARLPKHYTGPVTVSLVAWDGEDRVRKNRWTWLIPDGSKRYDGTIAPTMESVQ
jgi:hypothetical protein